METLPTPRSRYTDPLGGSGSTGEERGGLGWGGHREIQERKGWRQKGERGRIGQVQQEGMGGEGGKRFREKRKVAGWGDGRGCEGQKGVEVETQIVVSREA